MDLFRIAVLDDDERERKETCRILTEIIDRLGMRAVICAYASSSDLLYDFEEAGIDCYVLDVVMPEAPDGFQAAKQIRARYPYVPILFLTNYFDYAMDGYEVGACRYLLKGQAADKLEEILRLTYEAWEEAGRRICIDSYRGGAASVLLGDIQYAETEGRRCRIRIGGEYHYVGKTLCSLQEELGENFVQIRKDCLVNIENVIQMNGDTIRMKNGEETSVSRRYKQDFRRRLMMYLGGGDGA